MSVKVDVRQLERLQEQIEKVATIDIDAFCEACAKELAARLLRKVIKRTPVGDYSGASYTCASDVSHKGNKVTGKVGGTLRRGWSMKQLHHFDDTYVIEIINPVEYASYVEYGHRNLNGKWTSGHFMLTISKKEIEQLAPKLLENRLNQLLKECFK